MTRIILKMNLKVNRPKSKTVKDLFLKFGRVIVKNKRISFLIRQNYFERKNVKKTLERRLKKPSKLLMLEEKKDNHVVIVSKDGQKRFKILKVFKKFTKSVSKKYILKPQFDKIFKKIDLKPKAIVAYLKIVKEEPSVENAVDLKIAECQDIEGEKSKLKEVKITQQKSFKVQCKICGNFLLKQCLKKHIYSMHSKNIKWLQCTICKKKLKSKTNLRLHIENVHSSHGIKLICDYCGRDFKYKQSLRNHMKQHGGGQPKYRRDDLICKLCGLYRPSKKHLDIHLQDHPVCNFKCFHLNCERTFRSKNCLKSHLTLHFEKNLKCTVEGCGKTFKTHLGLMEHKISHSDLRPFKCTTCNITFKRSNHLGKHYRVKHKEYIQNKVKSIAKGDPLWYRKMSIDEIIARTEIIHDNNDNGYCLICSKLIPKYFLEHHLQYTHFVDRLEFNCDYCRKDFKTKYVLKEHLFVHTDMFKCPKCSKRCKSIRALQNHIFSHNTEQNYECPDCKISFKTEINMKMHQQRKTDQRIKCSVIDCQKFFKCKEFMRKHLKTVHQTERAIKCPYSGCEKMFKTERDLRNHEIRHNKPKFRCSKCSKLFKRKTTLKKHAIKSGHLE